MSDVSTDEPILFSARYGLRSHLDTWGRDSYECRHSHKPEDRGWGNCERDQRFRCACPGGSRRFSPCCQRATAEDRLCDGCRRWCVAIDDDSGSYRRFIGLYGWLVGRIFFVRSLPGMKEEPRD